MKFKEYVTKLLWIAYCLSGFALRSKKIWVFGSYGNTFTDNAKYLYLAKDTTLLANKIKFIWITGDKKLVADLQGKGLLAYYRWSLPGVVYTLRARYLFYNSYPNDINFWFSRGAVLVNLWHGIPLKKIEFDIKSGALAHIFSAHNLLNYVWNRVFYPWHYKRPDFILTPSETVGLVFNGAFRVTSENWLLAGYPRNDQLARTKQEALDWVKAYGNDVLSNVLFEIENHNKIVVYMPTWRDSNPDFFEDSGFDFSKIEELFEINNALLIIKLHPNVLSKIILSTMYKHIAIVNSDVDIYTLLPVADLLITDYSSIFFDYLVTENRMIFYPFDLDEYLNKNRELYYEYAKFVPGRIAMNFDDLCKLIFSDESVSEQKKRYGMKRIFWKYQQRNSAKMIIEKFCKL